MMLNRIESKAPKYARNKYIVAMTVEFYKEMVVKAGSPEEAQQMAGGYSIGDVDMIEVKEEK